MLFVVLERNGSGSDPFDCRRFVGRRCKFIKDTREVVVVEVEMLEFQFGRDMGKGAGSERTCSYSFCILHEPDDMVKDLLRKSR